MAESRSDLEAPLLISEQPQTEQPLQSQDSGGSAANEPKRKWKVRSLNREGLQSGKWQFQYDKFVQEKDFAERGGLTRGEREYNRKQRKTLAGFREVDNVSRGVEPSDDANALAGREQTAINLSNGLNVVLLVVKIYASVKSGSLAIVASTLDSLLDMMAGFVLWFAHFYMQRKNRAKYPIGKLRIQPVGIVIFAAMMAVLGMQVFITGVEQLMEGGEEPMDPGQRYWLIAIMGSATLVKLGLYLYCCSFDDAIVKVYAMDHFFDIVTNIVGLAAALLADYFYWWIDPAGAIFLALYTVINWGKTVFENAVSLVGKTAPPEVLQKLTYMAFNHHRSIQRIDNVLAYTFGTYYFVEVDIELPEDMPLKEAHEIGESLQDKLELLPDVERAFVHLDYESTHRPEHSAAELKQ